MGFSIGRFFVKPAPAPAPTAAAKPTAPAARTPAQEPEDVLSIGKNVRHVTVGSKAALTITARSGDTYWGLARRYAATKNGNGVPSGSEIRAYVKDLQALNGPDLKAGQEVQIPLTKRATFKLSALIAAQQDVLARQKAGEKLPPFDWSTADAKWGYAESQEVTVRPSAGGNPEVLAVREQGPAKGGGSTYAVATVQAAEPKAPAQTTMRKVLVPTGGALAITAQPGDSYWGIARRFAASMKAPEAPSGVEIRAYVSDLEKLNGKTLKAGQTVKLPLTANASFMLPALIAAQQDWLKRREQGHDVPELDWGAASARWDYAESLAVTVPGKPGAWSEKLSVREYGPAKGGTEFEVAFSDDFYRMNGLE